MMKDATPDWRPLSYILQELRSFDHRFSSALNYFESESAVVNAIRSGEVAVRGRRNNGFSSLRPAFERIEKYLGAASYVDISFNRINIPDDGVVLESHTRMNPFRLQINHEIFPSSTSVAIPGGGAAGCFTDAEADLRGVEKWIRENALPPQSLAEEEAARELPGLNKRKRASVLEAIASIGIEDLKMMLQKDRESEVVDAVGRAHGLRVTTRYVRKLYKETLRNVPKNCS